MYKDYQERVDTYIRGEMNADEKLQFDADLVSDLELNRIYSETKVISDAIADRKEKLNLMASWIAEEELAMKIRRHKMRVYRWTLGLGAAACFVAGLFLLKPMFYMTSSHNDYVMPDFSTEIYYRGGDSSLERLDSMISATNYTDALALSDSIIKENKLVLAKYEAMDSISEKESYQKLQIEDEIYELEWRKANLLIATGDKHNSRVILEKLTTKEGEYKEKARTLLEQIKKLYK